MLGRAFGWMMGVLQGMAEKSATQQERQPIVRYRMEVSHGDYWAERDPDGDWVMWDDVKDRLSE